MFKWVVTYRRWNTVYKGYVEANDRGSAQYQAEIKYGNHTYPMVEFKSFN